MPYIPPFTITPRIVSLIADISEALGRLEASASEALPLYLRKKNRIKTIVGTLEIEGNTLGEEKITAILEGKRVLGSMLEVSEVQGAIKVYEMLSAFSSEKVEDLLQAHKVLMGDILKDAGAFRKVDVGVGGADGMAHVAPPSVRVPELMENLFAWLKDSEDHPLIKSSVFHYEFEFIHPFEDGNGRMGRLWQSVILYQWKPVFASVPTESVVREHQQAYYEALEMSGKAGESTPFIVFMLESILQAVTSASPQSDQVYDQVSDQVKKMLQTMGDGWLSAQEIMEKLGLKHKPTFRKNYLNPALDQGLIKMMQPESPRSPKQKYRRTKCRLQ